MAKDYNIFTGCDIITPVKKAIFPILLVALSMLSAATENAFTVSENTFTEIQAEAPTSSVKALSFDLLAEDRPLYEVVLDDYYAPGEIVTLNVHIVSASAKIDAVSAVFFGQKIKLTEFEDKVWLGRYRLEKGIPAGNYFIKLYLRGEPSINVFEKIDLTVAERVAGVLVKGCSHVSPDIVYESLNIKQGDYFSAIKAEVNRQRILDTGFFEKVSIATKPTVNGVNVIYWVKENPMISKVDILGSIEFSKDELLNHLELKQGSLLSNRQLQKDVVALEKFYQEKDFIFFRILSVERPTSLNGYQLIYRIDESKIKDITIEGNSVTQKYVIVREMDLKKGDIFNAGKLREDLRRIYNLNYFGKVEPDLNFNEDTGEVDVKIKVEEKKTSSVNFGGGYGQLQGWFGFADLFLDNIAGTAQSTLFKAQFGQLITSYQFKYFNPWMWDRKTSFTGKLWSTYGYNFLSGQRELRNGWSATIGFQRSLYVQESYTYRYEDIFNTDDRSRNYLDRAVGYSLSYDNRDQWMNPTKGMYNVFSMDHSTKALGGTINASRYSLQFNQFSLIADKQVWAMRQMYNYQLGDIFPAEQYYVGSDSTVRGYRYIFAKGNERAVFNFEYRYIFSDMFVGVLFYDIGQATKPIYDELDDENNFVNHNGWGSGMGFGIRVITPMGPIRLDYGWPQYYEFADGFLSFNMGHVF